MTPQKKATSLTDAFYQKLPLERYVQKIDGDILINYNTWDVSKECALIAVDEIYKLRLNIEQHLKTDEDKENYYSYWEEVKQEIEKL